MTEKGGTGWRRNSGNSKGGVGHEGSSGDGVRTPEDEALARRRFDEYVRLTRDKTPGTYDNEDVIKALPMNGGTKLDCGETRFEHLMNDDCINPQKEGERCNREMRNGKPCSRRLGHPKQCMSQDYAKRQQENAKKRRARERAKVAESNR